MNALVAGAVAGLSATAPMTAAMLTMHRWLPPYKRYPLPHWQIAMNLASKLGIETRLNRQERTAATYAAHFGYGTFVGGLFGLIAPRDLSRSIPVGIGYGLLVWAGSYLGLLPALGLLSPATRHPKDRNALMIAAHVVWGAVAGALTPAVRDSLAE